MRAMLRSLGVGLTIGTLASCSSTPTEIGSVQPALVETSEPTAAPTQTLPPEATLSATPSPSDMPTDTPTASPGNAHTMPTVRPDGSVQGASEIYDYKGVTPEDVYTMEHCGNDSDKVLLTFDDAGTPDHIRAIAAELTSRHIGAIFFPNFGPVDEGLVDQAMFDELRQDGFWVGNHTADHPDLTKMTKPEIADAIKSGGEATLFRPPYGATYLKDGEIYFDGRVKQVAENLGRRICIWSVDTKDWDHLSAEQITANALDQVQPGSVILMHMRDAYNTLEALPDIIDGITKRGLELCALQTTPTSKEIPPVLTC